MEKVLRDWAVIASSCSAAAVAWFRSDLTGLIETWPSTLLLLALPILAGSLVLAYVIGLIRKTWRQLGPPSTSP